MCRIFQHIELHRNANIKKLILRKNGKKLKILRRSKFEVIFNATHWNRESGNQTGQTNQSNQLSQINVLDRPEEIEPNLNTRDQSYTRSKNPKVNFLLQYFNRMWRI